LTVAYFVGGTGTGKTTLACRLAMEQAGKRGVPGILIDSEGVVGSDKWDAETPDSLQDLVRVVWQEGRHARWVVRDPEEVSLISEAIRRGKDIVLCVDEISYWGRGASPIPELARLFRVHRHSRVDIYATSQYPGDISPMIWNVRTHAYVFRNDSVRAIERLRVELGLLRSEEDAIRTLPNLKYETFETGRPREGAGAGDGQTSLSRGGERAESAPPHPQLKGQEKTSDPEKSS
jgi:KaiC/GvpD/RAD55 family RecA-like ATPase